MQAQKMTQCMCYAISAEIDIKVNIPALTLREKRSVYKFSQPPDIELPVNSIRDIDTAQKHSH